MGAYHRSFARLSVITLLLTGCKSQLLSSGPTSSESPPPTESASIACPFQLPSKPALGVPVTQELSYGCESIQKMDITYTPGETGPLLLEIHGGGWFSGDKADSGMAGFRAYFRSLGFVVVSMNYRLVNQGSPSTGAHFPEPINDVACALATLTQNAAFFGVNSRRVLFGHSSGGHLATLLALSPEGRNGSVWGDSTCGVSVSRQDLTVDGAIGSSPLFDLSLAPSGRDTDISNMLNLLNLGTDNFRNHPDVYLPASPIHYVNSFDAPIFAVIGGADGFINAPQQDAAMGPAMNAAGNFYDSIVVAGWSHNEFQLEMRTYNPAISPTGSLKTVLDRVYGYLADDLDVLTP